MTQLSREERFRLAAEAEDGMPVSAGPRVGHARTAEGGGRFLYLDLLRVRESERPALVTQISALVAKAAAASADEERDPTGAAAGNATEALALLSANLQRMWEQGDDPTLDYRRAVRSLLLVEPLEPARRWAAKIGLDRPDIPATESNGREKSERKGSPEHPDSRDFNECITSYDPAAWYAEAIKRCQPTLASPDVSTDPEAITRLVRDLALASHRAVEDIKADRSAPLERFGAIFAFRVMEMFRAAIAGAEGIAGADQPADSAESPSA
jgi:hypothetical protein